MRVKSSLGRSRNEVVMAVDGGDARVALGSWLTMSCMLVSLCGVDARLTMTCKV